MVLGVVDSPFMPRGEVEVRREGEDFVTSGARIRRKFSALKGQKDSGRMDDILTGGRRFWFRFLNRIFFENIVPECKMRRRDERKVVIFNCTGSG